MIQTNCMAREYENTVSFDQEISLVIEGRQRYRGWQITLRFTRKRLAREHSNMNAIILITVSSRGRKDYYGRGAIY